MMSNTDSNDGEADTQANENPLAPWVPDSVMAWLLSDEPPNDDEIKANLTERENDD